MKKYSLIITAVIFIFCSLLFPGSGYIEVDFAKLRGLEGNAQGPHVLIADNLNLRVFAACVNSSSVAVIDAKTDKVNIIPITARMPRRLRVQGSAINKTSGELILAGQNSIVIINPIAQTSKTIALNYDYPSVAVDEKTGNVLAVGRQSGDLAVVKPKSDKAAYIAYGHKEADIQYFAVSPPTPIRTVWISPAERRIYIFDGTVPKLYIMDADTFKIINSRSLSIPPFPRWHWGGPDWEEGRFYLSVEDDKRASRYAISVDLKNSDDIVVQLPSGATEPTGVSISTKRNELYIPYDNNDFIHAISFSPEPKIEQIQHNAKYGIDSSVYDEETGLLYAPSWAEGIMYEIDAAERKIVHHTPYFPVYPHMNNFAYIPALGKIYVPSGATAVNGTFGSLITVLNIKTLEQKTIYTGWSPVSLAEIQGVDKYIISGSDDTFAMVSPDGSAVFKKLPYPYLHEVVFNDADNNIYLTYGPHYSIFPAFYIKATRGGIYKMNMDGEILSERQTDRLAHRMLIDDDNFLWATENIWGKEEPRLIYFDLNDRQGWGKLLLPPAIDNECALRGMKINPNNGDLWVFRNGDRYNDSGLAFRINPKTKTLVSAYPVGIAPTDIAFLDRFVLLSGFAEDKVTIIDSTAEIAESTKPLEINSGDGPIAIAVNEKLHEAYVLNHNDLSLSIFILKEGKIVREKIVKIPGGYKPGNLCFASGNLYISAHKSDQFILFIYDPSTGKFDVKLKTNYPYGEVGFDQNNASFANPAQWGDAIYRLNEFSQDSKGRLWVTDYLSGKLWIFNLSDKGE